MATMTATATHDTKTIKRAMNKIGLDDRANDLLDILDKMELDRQLKISMEEADRGECSDLDEAIARIRKEINEG